MRRLVIQHNSQEFIETFEKLFNLTYSNHLEFVDEGGLNWLNKRRKKLLRDKGFRLRNQWTSALFKSDFCAQKHPPIEIDEVNALVGLGVFASSPIKALAYVGEYTGVVRPRQKKTDQTNNYAFRYLESRFRVPYLIDAKNKGNFCRFINHSDEPNLLSTSLLIEGVYHIIFFTKRGIEANEQLTYDYGEAYWRARAVPLLL
ncbi:MAG: SET domain-containing protein-lysine N-methyltransferase [Simkaniaceae bacterium]|nr:SET domain-containing protein-lysine N-methyltransferase [Simkaniaceae bacterium]MCF7852788.1 SET domain-containing protein-lysine N-methyltransferase [Simkaniaceae bacterium]